MDQTGWLEIPAASEGSDFKEATIYDGSARNYSFHYDYSTYASLWVAYPLAPADLTGTQYSCNTWEYYSGIEVGKQVNIWDSSYGVNVGSTSNSDYDSTLNIYSRGHQIPNADRQYVSQQMVDDTYLAINSTPQIQNRFNGGIWSALESAIRTEVSDYGDTVYITTGPVYRTNGGNESLTYIYPKSDSSKAVPLPNYYYKVVLKVKGSSAEAVGFWMEHKEYSSSNYASYAVSVDYIEEITGLDFFVNLEDTLENDAESNSSWSTFQAF